MEMSGEKVGMSGKNKGVFYNKKCLEWGSNPRGIARAS